MSFLLIILYTFCTIIRPQDWMLGFLNLPLINWLAIATLVVVVLERMAAKDGFLSQVPQNFFMIGLFVCVLMSHVANTYFWGLINSFNAFIILFVLFFIMLNSLNRSWKIWGIVWVIILLVAPLVLQGMDQIKNGGIGWAGQEITYDYGRNEVRINWIGIFNDPNDLALIFVIAIGFLLPLIFRPSNFIIKLASLALIAWLGYGIFLTNSRGGYLAMLGTMFFFFIRLTNRMFLGSVIGACVVAAVFALGPSRLGLISAEESSAYSRLELWYWGLQMLLHHPLFGIGYNMFTDQMPLTAHNSYILAGAELGFIGLFFWVGLIYVSYKGLSSVYERVDSLKTLALGVQSGLMGFSVAAFFLSRTYVILPYLLFALSGAVMMVAKDADETLDFSLTGKDYRNITMICLGILVFVFVLYKVGL